MTKRCSSRRPRGSGAPTARSRVTTASRCQGRDSKVTVHAKTEASGRRVPTSGYKVKIELRYDVDDETKLMTIDGGQQASHDSRVYRNREGGQAWESLRRERENCVYCVGWCP